MKKAWATITWLILFDPVVMWALYMGIAISAAIPECPSWVPIGLTAWKAVRSKHKQQRSNENNSKTPDGVTGFSGVSDSM